jgi:hypothetical protein
MRSTVASSTSIKAVGGLSALDARSFAREMRCEPEFLQGMRKEAGDKRICLLHPKLHIRAYPLDCSLGRDGKTV